MCRLLLVQFETPEKPMNILARFARMAKKNKAPDGDWQGDGWGVAWLGEQNQWQVQKSLEPIWKEAGGFTAFPRTRTFVAHARSASFPQHKGIIEFNQPYIFGKYAFVFNGLLKGVTLSNASGKIGAEKIWHLLQLELKNNTPQKALETTKRQLLKNSKKIIALNIGLATPKNIYSLNYFTKNPEYYTLHHWQENSAVIICSEPLEV